MQKEKKKWKVTNFKIYFYKAKIEEKKKDFLWFGCGSATHVSVSWVGTV